MTLPASATLARHWEDVERDIATACDRAGRPRQAVTLVAVTKYAELDWLRGLYELGCRDFGEARPQQLVERAAQLPGDIRWHLIGHLQRNKASLVWPVANALHSVDSLRLAQRLNDVAVKTLHRPQVLLEVNVSGEGSKDGFTRDELRSAWRELLALDNLNINGLMTMAPQSDDPETARPVFRALRTLRDELQHDRPLPQLSIGMSDDFRVAIEEGATMVRIGSRLFDGLA